MFSVDEEAVRVGREHPPQPDWPGTGRTWLMMLLLLILFFAIQYVPLETLALEDPLGEGGSSSAEVMGRSIQEGDPKRQVALGLLGLLGAVPLFSRRVAPLRLEGTLGWLVLAYLGWVTLSLAWAEQPGLAFRRWVILLFFYLGALAVARCFPRDALLRFAFLSSLSYLLVCLGVEVASGHFQPFSASYRFAGVFHPNFQGLNCTLLLLTALHFGHTHSGVRRFIYRGAALAGLIFLVLSKSRTSLVCALSAVLLYWLLVLPRIRKLHLAVATGWCASLVLLLAHETLAHHLEHILAMGREGAELGTLTGRVPLWSECFRYVAEQPLVGFGYQSFWTPRNMTAIAYRIGWAPYASHSLYIDLLLGVGLIGLLLYLALQLGGVGRALARFRSTRDPWHALAAALFLFGLQVGLVETSLLNPNLLSFVSLALLLKLAVVEPG